MNINIPEYEVSQFNRLLKNVVETNFDYIRIRGEISELKNASSGHIYLTLKDSNSVLNATIWNQKINYLQFQPEIGMEVIVTGKISTYAKSISTYSINIDKLELAGEGALLKLIEDRKLKLQKAGIFDKDFKKDIPYLPNKIGVITSPTGAVIHDIINRIKERCPTNIDMWPVNVQGINAVKNIIEAIEGFNKKSFKNKPDVIIIARGGGGIEDLMAFNDEQLVRAVFNSVIPIISAIGHETDTTIIDFVSDLRASTPTAAAEKVVPMKKDLEKIILNFLQRLDFILQNKYETFHSKFIKSSKFLKAPDLIINSYREKFYLVSDNIFDRVQNSFFLKENEFINLIKLIRLPNNIIKNSNKDLSNTVNNINKNIDNIQTINKKELNKFIRLLESNSLYSNLKKGYSIIRKSNRVINKSTLVKNDDTVNIQFLDKNINLKIKKIN